MANNAYGHIHVHILHMKIYSAAIIHANTSLLCIHMHIHADSLFCILMPHGTVPNKILVLPLAAIFM